MSSDNCNNSETGCATVNDYVVVIAHTQTHTHLLRSERHFKGRKGLLHEYFV